MDNRINILNELKELDAAILSNTDNKNYFFIPANYFNDFAGNLQAQVYVQSLPRLNFYSVPSNYFENFPDTVLERIQFEKSAENLKAIKQPAFTVPENYFEDFAGSVLKKIKSVSEISVQQELEEISPLLNSISKKNVYSIPENYFNQLEILPKQNISTKAKVVSIGSRARKWFSYAAAACVAAILSIGGYKYYNTNRTIEAGTQPSIAGVDVQKEISTLSDEEINNYLKSNNSIAVYTSTNDADQQQPKMDVQTLLQNVSDEEIQEYLNQDPESHETGGGI